MKFKIVKIGIALLMTAALLVLSGCPKEADETVFSSDATLKSIELNGEAGVLVEGVPKDQWLDVGFTEDSMSFSSLYVNSNADLTPAVLAAVPTDSKANVRYGKGTISEGPYDWSESGTFSLADNDCVYIAVTAEDKKTRNYYKAQVQIKGVASLTRLSISEQQVMITDADPAEELASVVFVNALLTGTQTTNALVVATTAHPSATVQFAKAPVSGAPTFGSTATFTFAEGDVLYIKSVSNDGSKTLYYGVKINYLPSSTFFVIAGVPNEITGIPGAAWNGVGVTSGYICVNGDQNTTAKSISVYPGANVKEVAISTTSITANNAATTEPVAWSSVLTQGAGPDANTWTTTWPSPNLANNRIFYIRVTSTNDAVKYYRFHTNYQANYVRLVNSNTGTNAGLVIESGGTSVNPASAARGTPAGSWNATNLVAGTATVTIVGGKVTVTTTWQGMEDISGYQNKVQFAVTSNLTTAPQWGAATITPENPFSATANAKASSELTVSNGNYIWIQNQSIGGRLGNYRNVYVIKVN